MPILPPAMQSAVGTSGEEQTHTVERGAIQRFVEAIGEANPAYPGVAPPTFLRSLGRAIPPLPDGDAAPRSGVRAAKFLRGRPSFSRYLRGRRH